jgi:hypothetical protein
VKINLLGLRLWCELFAAWVCVRVARLLLSNCGHFCFLLDQGHVSYRIATAMQELASPERLLLLTWRDTEGKVRPGQEAAFFDRAGLAAAISKNGDAGS